jgi:hypothetical protein
VPSAAAPSASATNFAANVTKRRDMSELRVGLHELLPIKEASRSLAQAVERLERHEAEQFVITRRNKPSAVIVALSRYEDLLRREAHGSI